MAKTTNSGGYPQPNTSAPITSSDTYSGGVKPHDGGGGTDGSRVSHAA